MTLSILVRAVVGAGVLTAVCHGAVRLMTWLDAWLARETDTQP